MDIKIQETQKAQINSKQDKHKHPHLDTDHKTIKSQRHKENLQRVMRKVPHCLQVSTIRLSEDFCRNLGSQRQWDDILKTLKENKQTNKLSSEEEKEI